MTVLRDSESLPEHLLMHNVSWELYERLLRETEGQNLRFTYDYGVLEITSPLSEHEQAKIMIGRFIFILALELNIPIASYGSTTPEAQGAAQGCRAGRMLLRRA